MVSSSIPVIRKPEIGETISVSTPDAKYIISAFCNDKVAEIPHIKYTKWFDYDRISTDLHFRSKMPGDYFVIDASGKSQLFRRYCINEKIPSEKRDKITLFAEENKSDTLTVKYISQIETAINKVKPAIENYITDKINSRWLSLKLLDYDHTLINEVNTYLGSDILSNNTINNAVDSAIDYLNRNKISSEELKSKIVSCLVLTAEGICSDTVKFNKDTYNSRDRKIDKLLASRIIGYPIMILALLVIFWITITGANYPSQLLSDGLFWIEDKLVDFAKYIHAPKFIYEMLIFGVYRVLAWVVSVMLPPMAIFFPLFTLLEDSGFLPRIAFNLDKQFKKCNACGKQALTMWVVDIGI